MTELSTDKRLAQIESEIAEIRRQHKQIVTLFKRLGGQFVSLTSKIEKNEVI